MPVLELDSGAIINDAIAICVYFEETHPEPPLIGRTPEEKAVTIAWNRRVERDGFYAVMEAFRNATPGLKGRAVPGPDDYEQIPALAERGRARVRRFFETLNIRLGESPFVAGPRYSMADITAQVTIEFAKWAKLTPPEVAPTSTAGSRPSPPAPAPKHESDTWKAPRSSSARSRRWPSTSTAPSSTCRRA